MKVSEAVLKEFIGLLDQTISLLRQDIVSLRNDFVQHKLDIEQIKYAIASIKEDKRIRVKYHVASLTAGASIVISIMQYLTKGK